MTLASLARHPGLFLYRRLDLLDTFDLLGLLVLFELLIRIACVRVAAAAAASGVGGLGAARHGGKWHIRNLRLFLEGTRGREAVSALFGDIDRIIIHSLKVGTPAAHPQPRSEQRAPGEAIHCCSRRISRGYPAE